jgi:hypothetical protein
MLGDLLREPLEAAEGIEVHAVDGGGARMRRALATLNPDWVILEVGDTGLTGEYLELFDVRPRVKMLAFANHGARSLVCVQLGSLAPSTLIQALDQVDTKAWVDVAG